MQNSENISPIIFSFELKDSVIVDVKEHSSLYKASCYIGFIVNERPNQGTRYITSWYMKPEPATIYSDAKWVVDLTYFNNPDHIAHSDLLSEDIVWEALKMLNRFKNIDIILNDN